MLKGISQLIMPELLMLLADMGHCEELLLADRNFPAGKFCHKVLVAPGTDIPAMLNAIIPLWPLDYKSQPLLMPTSSCKDDNQKLAKIYCEIIRQFVPDAPDIQFIGAKAFYSRAGGCRVCVVTGDSHRFANLIIRKGVL